MTKARDISKLLSTANGKIAGANLDVSFENISDTGTAGTKVASGTTGQRGSTAGQIRFNTTTGLAEYYTGSEFKVIDSPPTVTAVSPLEVDSAAGGNVTFTITGSNFQSGAVAKFIGNDATELTASTTTITNSTTISAVIAKSSFVGAKEPYDVKIINTSGLSGTLDNQINVDASPAWSTASGNIANILDDATGTHATVSATDADGDTVSYSETGGTVLTTAGLTLNSSTGAISGNPTNVASDTTYNFTLRATANAKTVDRAFNIIVGIKDGTTSAKANISASAILTVAPSSTNGWYYIKPSGYGGSAFQVYCDFTTAGGGFMHVATIHDNSSDLNNSSVNPWSYGLHRTAISSGSITHDSNAIGYWGSTSTLNSGSTGSGLTAFGQDYKDTAYNAIPFTKILMKDQGSSFRNLWYTTNNVPNSATYATSAQNWFSNGGRSGGVWQSAGGERSNTTSGLRLPVTNFSNNDDVFGSSISNVVFFFGEPSGHESGNQDRSVITSGDSSENVSTTQGIGVSRAYDFGSQVFRDIDPTYSDEPTSNSSNYTYTLWVR
jgi:hypothetical protein